MNDRAVNEVISFALVFALITTVVALVSIVGLGGLEDARDAEQINNAERAFDVFADNQQDIYLGGAPSRATEIKLAGALLSTGDASNFRVIHDDADSPYRIQPKPIVYAKGDSKLVYEAGAVFRVDGDNAIMLREPPMRFGTDRTTITYYETRGTPGAVSGDTTMLVRTVVASQKTLHPQGERANPGSNVSFIITTTEARAPAWEGYIEGTYGNDICTVSDQTVSCSFPTDELYVRSTIVNVYFN